MFVYNKNIMNPKSKKPKTSYKRKFDYPNGSGVHKSKKDYSRKDKKIMYPPKRGEFVPNDDFENERYQ